MDKQSFIEVQKNGIMMHRLIYVIFFLQRLLLHFQSDTILLRNTIVIISFIVKMLFSFQHLYTIIHAEKIQIIS